MVKKSVLEQKSNQELEVYIQPENLFVPEAIKLAFEILKSRGRDFSNEEVEQINLLINRKDEEVVIQPNYIKSSNLMFFSAGLGIINFLLSSKFPYTTIVIFSAIGTLVFLLILGVLIRKGISYLKYVLAFLFIFGIFGFIKNLIYDLQYFPINAIISIFQFAIQILAVVLLFMIPKKK